MLTLVTCSTIFTPSSVDSPHRTEKHQHPKVATKFQERTQKLLQLLWILKDYVPASTASADMLTLVTCCTLSKTSSTTYHIEQQPHRKVAQDCKNEPRIYYSFYEYLKIMTLLQPRARGYVVTLVTCCTPSSDYVPHRAAEALCQARRLSSPDAFCL